MEKIVRKLRSIKLRVLLTILVGVSAAPAVALAIVITLNGQTGRTQLFANDSNVTITSSGDTHSLGWSGVLPVSRGGTGASSFSAGSILFSNGTFISQDNVNLFWDDTNKLLKVGGLASISNNLEIGGFASISGMTVGTWGLSTIPTVRVQDSDVGINALEIFAGNGLGNNRGGSILINAGNASGSGDGGPINVNAGIAGPTGNGGSVQLEAQDGGTISGNGGDAFIIAGGVQGVGIGGSVEFNARAGGGGGANGTYRFLNPITGAHYGFLNLELIVGSDKIFTFPNIDGTFSLLEADQTWTGLNKFESTASSTIYIGSPTKSGCIVMGDSDSSGVTYITANNGVLSASSTKPSICQ